MSSVTKNTYEQGKLYICYEWDKYFPNYVVAVSELCGDGIHHERFYKRYETEEQAKRSFRRQVAKAKKGWY